MATEKFGPGKPASLTTVIEVWLAVMGDASVVRADWMMTTACRTAPSAVVMSAWVIWVVVVAHPPAASGGVSR